MTNLDNRSGFAAELLSFPTTDAQEVQVLVVSATYVQTETAEMAPSEAQRPVPVADVYFGDPANSSLRYEAESATEKPLVDILVNGSACTPRGQPAESVIAELVAGDISKRVRVVGDRFRSVAGPSAPRPFVTMPLIYERAYGGSDQHDPDSRRQFAFRPNPVGVGYRSARPQSPAIETEYPNLELVGVPVESRPAGFGIVSRAWTPRLEWAGTFDQSWLDTQWPLLPRDFDVRHYQAAPVDQQSASLRAGDLIQLTNFTRSGTWQFSLPSTNLSAWLIFDGRVEEAFPRMDTVLIEPDSRTVALTFRLKLTLERGRERLREIVIGATTPGVLRAKQRRKPYLDLRSVENQAQATASHGHDT